MNWLKHALPITEPHLLLGFFLISSAVGISYDLLVDTRFDGFIHDEALASKPRKQWNHTVIIALDNKIPEYISRKQTLPLFAKAAENAFKAGVKKIFMDAVIFQSSPNMLYALCIENENQQVVWNSSDEVFNPLGPISAGHIGAFSMAHPSPNVELFTLFNLEAALLIDEAQLFSDIKIYHRTSNYFSTVTRLLNLSPDSGPVKLAAAINPERMQMIIQPTPDDVACGEDGDRLCRRIRFTDVKLHTSKNPEIPVIPLSELVQCNNQIKPEIKQILQNKVAIMQLATLDETIDLHLTPLSTSLSGNGKLTHGSQIIADAVETLLEYDHPKRPSMIIKIILICLVALSCVLATAYLKAHWALMLASFWVVLTTVLCFSFPITQLWPIAAVTLTALIALTLCFSSHLAFGTQRGIMIAKYLPEPIRSMLLSTGNNSEFVNKKTQAVVLISDVEGYTMVTSLLKDPALIFNLINEYLEETTIILQEQYHGWLENYVGDMVCFYWPADNEQEFEKQQLLALQAAIMQSQLQQTFFRSLRTHDHKTINKNLLDSISSVINAGIGVSTGDIVMGNLGPKDGVQKFGVLGDPLNLSSRIEGLTRFFNTEIIITSELVDSARMLNLKIRKIARVKVKGRTEGCDIYALGKFDDLRFTDQIIKQWDYFYYLLVERGDSSAPVPEVFSKDAQTLKNWFMRNQLDKKTKTWIIHAS